LKTLSVGIVAALAWAALVSPYASAQAPANTQASHADANADDADADADEPQPMMGVELDDEAARGHFQGAQALFRIGRYSEAGGEFERAYELSHRPEMLFNAFVAYRDGADLERAVAALTHYLDVEPQAEGAGQLRARLEIMQARIAEQARVEAERQRALTGQAEAEHERHEAERERHEAEARAAAERQRADEATTMSAQTRQAWVVTASGGGLLLASGVLALVAKSRVDSLDAQCPNNRCGDGVDLTTERNHARRAVIATDALWMTGAVVAGVGFVLLLTADSSDAPEEANPNAVGAFCDGHGCAASYRRAF